MEFILDTINLKEIEEGIDYLPIAGVTSNPTIVKRGNPDDFFKHMKKIRNIISKDRSLHIQVSATKAELMIEEAYKITEEIDDLVYIKVPVSYEGIKAIRILKEKGFNVTATGVYDLMQGYYALVADADYIAVYINRIGNLGADPMDLIYNLSNQIIRYDYKCKIVSASFKGVEQVRNSLNNGSQAVTVTLDILKEVFNNPNIDKAVDSFTNDWNDLYKGKNITEL